MDTSGITDEMWAKGEQHLKKLLEARPAPDGSPNDPVDGIWVGVGV